MAYIPGQRWISNAEPELGLGTVVRLDGRTVQILFATAGVLRRYATHAAPLTRAQFRVGQKISGQKQSFAVERISEAGGLITYHGAERTLVVPAERTVGHFVPGMPFVYATPMMILEMEMTSGDAIRAALQPGWVTVGTEVDIAFTLPDGVEIRGRGVVRWARGAAISSATS